MRETAPKLARRVSANNNEEIFFDLPLGTFANEQAQVGSGYYPGGLGWGQGVWARE
jgi:hypothetical protein